MHQLDGRIDRNVSFSGGEGYLLGQLAYLKLTNEDLCWIIRKKERSKVKIEEIF